TEALRPEERHPFRAEQEVENRDVREEARCLDHEHEHDADRRKDRDRTESHEHAADCALAPLAPASERRRVAEAATSACRTCRRHDALEQRGTVAALLRWSRACFVA